MHVLFHLLLPVGFDDHLAEPKLEAPNNMQRRLWTLQLEWRIPTLELQIFKAWHRYPQTVSLDAWQIDWNLTWFPLDELDFPSPGAFQPVSRRRPKGWPCTGNFECLIINGIIRIRLCRLLVYVVHHLQGTGTAHIILLCPVGWHR